MVEIRKEGGMPGKEKREREIKGRKRRKEGRSERGGWKRKGMGEKKVDD